MIPVPVVIEKDKPSRWVVARSIALGVLIAVTVLAFGYLCMVIDSPAVGR